MSKRPIDLRSTIKRRCSDTEFAEAQRHLRAAMAKIKNLSPEQIAMLDAATSHGYDCQCPLCLQWWALSRPEA